MIIFNFTLWFIKMALVDFKLIADESEPSICVDLLNLSDSSSLISIEDEELNNLLKRRPSISLFDVSTPLEAREEIRKKYRYGSHYNIYSTDKKKRKYKLNANNKAKDEPKIFANQEVKTKKNNNIDFSPNISVKYAQALKEIETLQMEINKLKSEKSLTPLFVQRKSLQSSMIKKCLFRNSSTVLRPSQHNSTKSSIFASESTCMTIDVENHSVQTEDEVFNEFLITNNQETKQNSFLIKPESSISEQSNNSEFNCNNSKDPLITHQRLKLDRTISKVRSFVGKITKCPDFLRKVKRNKNTNKIPPVPTVVINSPKTPDNDSGHDSDIQQIRLEEFKVNSPHVEKLLTDMSRSAEELSQKLNKFINVLQTCMNQKNV